MKKFAVIFLFAAIAVAAFTSCKKKSSSVVGDQKSTSAAGNHRILVGASPVPHSQILEVIKNDLKADGFDLVVREFSDYVTPNEALEAGEIDANFFQHIPYMDSFNERGFHLVNVLGVHIEPMAAFSQKYSDAKSLKAAKGITIAVPNDPTNEGRALLLLESQGMIKLRDSSNLSSTPTDIASNPNGIRIVEVEAASLPRMLADVDAAVINGNYALSAGLDTNRSLFAEGKESPYVNIIAVRSGKENSDKTIALVKALKNGKVKDYIKSEYKKGEVVCVL